VTPGRSLIKIKSAASFEKKLSLASLLRNQGIFDEALALNLECFEHASGTMGEVHPVTLKACCAR
jgi:hypothetical protein